MKKAFLDQLLFGFIIALAIITFVATVNDETSTRNRINDLQDLASSSSQAMARYYELQVDMCSAQDVNKDILRKTKLGNYVLDNNLISFTWYDLSGDGEPDNVSTTIKTHEFNTFWYKFLNIKKFTIGPFTKNEPVDAPKLSTLRFGGGTTSNNSSVGLYQLDADGCVTNARLIMADQKATPTNTELEKDIKMPPNYLFIILGGGKVFTKSNGTEKVEFSEPHCKDTNNNYHKITIGTQTNTKGIFFEQTELNKNNDSFIHSVPVNVLDFYKTYVKIAEGDNSKDAYEEFSAACKSNDFENFKKERNSDSDSSNDVIDCITDKNGQYKYNMEDWDSDSADNDYNDLLIDSTQMIIPNSLNNYTVNDDGSIALTCSSGQNPVVTLSGCPLIINEDTVSTSDIKWDATDSDGTIENTTASANKGTAYVNSNGTITYTPPENFFGDDVITFKATDNEGLSGFGYCNVTVNAVNDNPTISGTPITTINAGDTYRFTPTAEDVDGDTLTFEILNKPSWASFDSKTGALTGTPNTNYEGTYPNIIITVKDGKGGKASLAPFTITVTVDDEVLLVSPIPDQTVEEDSTYSYDFSKHFSSSKTLNYSVTYSFNGSSGTINLPASSFSLNIPKGTAEKVATITVTASNGIKQASDTYIVTVQKNSPCGGPFEINFNNNFDSFAGGNRDGKSYRIDGGNYADILVDFGSECRNTDVTVAYTYKTTGNWEWDDRLKVYNGWFRIGTHEEQPSWTTFSTTAKTNRRGIVRIRFFVDTLESNDRAWIDDIILTAK